MEAQPHKSSVAKNVDLGLMAKQTQGFSGSDLGKFCQRAAKLTIRESIENYIAKARVYVR